MEAVISCIMNRPMGHCQETHGTKLWPMLKRPQTLGLESCLRNGDLTESARSVLRLKTRLVCDQAFVIPTPLGIVLTMCQGSLRVLPFRVIVPAAPSHRFDTPVLRHLLGSRPIDQPDRVHLDCVYRRRAGELLVRPSKRICNTMS